MVVRQASRKDICMVCFDQFARWKKGGLQGCGAGFTIALFACTQALACIPSSERNILYEHVPTGLNAPVIVEVTITDREADAIDPSNGNQMAVMNAQVDRVIKGAIDSKTIKVVTYLSDCSRIGVGTGIVAGTLRLDSQRGLELVALQKSDMRVWSEEFNQKQMVIIQKGRK